MKRLLIFLLGASFFLLVIESHAFREEGGFGSPTTLATIGAAPSDVDYLVGTADAGLSNEIAVGATPGGELGNTWASPTVDGTHSGSAHHDAATVNTPLTISTQDISITVAKDIVSGDGLSGGEDNVLPAADADLTLAVDLVAAGSDGDSATGQSDSGLEFVSGEVTVLRGCTDNQILKWDETDDDWNCEADDDTTAGDVESVGDCTGGACLDGTSDGGTNFALYDGNSNKQTVSSGDLSGDITFVLPVDDGDNLDVLTTNGGGTLSWAAPAGGATIATKYIVCETFTSAGINACIDSLGADGGEVYLPEGDWDITGVITIDADNTTLRGAGAGTRLLATNRFVYTTVSGTPAAGETLTGDTTGYTATVIQVDLTNKIVWYHSLSNAANYNNAEVISWSGAADTTINGVAATEQSFDAIDTNDKSFVTISDLTIYGGSGGGNTENLIGDNDDADNLTIENVWLYESDNNNIYAGGEDNLITGIYSSESDVYGIYNAGTDSIITGNKAIDSNSQFTIRAGAGGTITGNVAGGNAAGGILASSPAVVNDNYIIDGNGAGISAGNDSVVTGNRIKAVNNNFDSIVVSGDNNIISNNRCDGDGTGETCVSLDNSADNNLVAGNKSENMGTADFEDLGGSGNMFLGNIGQDDVPYKLGGTAPAMQETFVVQILSSTDPAITLTQDQCMGDWHYNGDADVIDYTLPGAAAGLNCCFHAGGNAFVVTIDPVDGTDTIFLDGATVGAGDAIDSAGGAGDHICVKGVDATNWMTDNRLGTFVDGGAD